ATAQQQDRRVWQPVAAGRRQTATAPQAAPAGPGAAHAPHPAAARTPTVTSPAADARLLQQYVPVPAAPLVAAMQAADEPTGPQPATADVAPARVVAVAHRPNAAARPPNVPTPEFPPSGRERNPHPLLHRVPAPQQLGTPRFRPRSAAVAPEVPTPAAPRWSRGHSPQQDTQSPPPVKHPAHPTAASGSTRRSTQPVRTTTVPPSAAPNCPAARPPHRAATRPHPESGNPPWREPRSPHSPRARDEQRPHVPVPTRRQPVHHEPAAGSPGPASGSGSPRTPPAVPPTTQRQSPTATSANHR